MHESLPGTPAGRLEFPWPGFRLKMPMQVGRLVLGLVLALATATPPLPHTHGPDGTHDQVDARCRPSERQGALHLHESAAHAKAPCPACAAGPTLPGLAAPDTQHLVADCQPRHFFAVRVPVFTTTRAPITGRSPPPASLA